MKPVSLYIHIPFCLRKCAYCDFNSGVYDGELAEGYLAAVEREMGLRGGEFVPETIYVGGGTPTCLSLRQLRKLLDAIEAHFEAGKVREFTVEANPATVGEEKARALLDGGVNRISLGAQSFQDPLLATLGRIHSADDTRSTYEILRKAGFRNISLDLIFAIPGETPEMWADDLRTACDMKPEHISAYCLTYEPNTPMGRGVLDGSVTPLTEDAEAEMYMHAVETLPGRGYEQYEISNFARPNRACVHNIAYWRNSNSLGIGAGAFSYIDGRRSSNARDTAEYMALLEKGRPTVFREELEREAAARETAVLGLRMTAGLNRNDFRERTGLELDSLFNGEIRGLIADGFLQDDGTTLRVSRKGLPVTDSLVLPFIQSDKVAE